MNLSGASIDFTAYHLDVNLDEGWHEHTWSITVWWPMEPFRDGRTSREALRSVMESVVQIDGEGRRCLPPEFWSNEALCRLLSILANVVKITIDRPGFRVEFWV